MTSVTVALFFLTVIMFLVTEFVIARFPPWGTKDKKDILSSIITFGLPAFGVAVLGVALVLVLGAYSRTSPSEVEWYYRIVLGSTEINFATIIGLGLAWGAFPIRLAAKCALGKYYTINVAILDDHQLVESGIYRYVRHPLNLGILMCYLGLPLIVNSTFGLFIVTLPATIGTFHRMRVEEKALINRFGERYLAYAKRTARLIPYVW